MPVISTSTVCPIKSQVRKGVARKASRVETEVRTIERATSAFAKIRDHIGSRAARTAAQQDHARRQVGRKFQNQADYPWLQAA